MTRCDQCNVAVSGEEFCPLCGGALSVGATGASQARLNSYPDLAGRTQQYNFVKRLLVFLSILAVGLCVLINLLATPGYLWCLIVVAVVAYCWLVIPPLLRKGQNFAAQTVTQVLLTSFLAVALDIIIGYRGWSVSYVVPGLLTAGITTIVLMMLFNRTNRAQYVLYQVILAVFGFAPLVLYFVGLAQNLVMVIVTVSLAFAVLLATFILGDRTIKSEFKRRFHF